MFFIALALVFLGFTLVCNIFVACATSIYDMHFNFVEEQNIVGKILVNTFFALAWLIQLAKNGKDIKLMNDLNHFYKALAMEDATFHNRQITLDDLDNEDELLEIEYDLNDHWYCYEVEDLLVRVEDKLEVM